MTNTLVASHQVNGGEETMIPLGGSRQLAFTKDLKGGSSAA
jgi:hypothetical protein